MIFNNFKIRFGKELERTEEICLHEVDFFSPNANEKLVAMCVPVAICLRKLLNRNTRTRCKVCSKLTIKTLERG